MKRDYSHSFLALLICYSITCVSCKKEETKACISGPTETTVYVNNSYSSCSEFAAKLEWDVEWSFPSEASIRHTEHTEATINQAWSDAGTFKITLTAHSEDGEEFDTESITVTVADRCFSCAGYDFNQQYEEVRVCASDEDFYEEVNYLSWMDGYRERGYTCEEE